MAKITVNNFQITIVSVNDSEYISLTDMSKSQMQEHIIFKWLSLKGTIEYIGEWEMLYNTDFNCTEFGTIKNAAGSNSFVLSTKAWIETTNAIGIVSKAGRYGDTYAHRDIAYHFGIRHQAFATRLEVSDVDGSAFFAIFASNSLQESSATQKFQ